MADISVYNFTDPKKFLRTFFNSAPKKGRGQFTKLAEHLGIDSSSMSQITKGKRDFSAEQGVLIAEYLGLPERATEYFVLLVTQRRAASKKLEEHIEKKLIRLREEQLQIKSKHQEHHELGDSDKGIFYSNWFYSGVRLLTSMDGYNSIDSIATYFGLSRQKVGDILSFLTACGLCREEKGRYLFGVRGTYVGEDSPFLNNHRRNWRNKALEKFSQPKSYDIFFSSPCSVSKKDAELVRKQLIELIESLKVRLGPSPAERLACLNIDWFEF